MEYFLSHDLVCVNSECLNKGVHEVMDSFQDELVAEDLLDEVQVVENFRISGCSNGPIMVWPKGVPYSGLAVDVDIPRYFMDFTKIVQDRCASSTGCVATARSTPSAAKGAKPTLSIRTYASTAGFVCKYVTAMQSSSSSWIIPAGSVSIRTLPSGGGL